MWGEGGGGVCKIHTSSHALLGQKFVFSLKEMHWTTFRPILKTTWTNENLSDPHHIKSLHSFQVEAIVGESFPWRLVSQDVDRKCTIKHTPEYAMLCVTYVRLNFIMFMLNIYHYGHCIL